MRILLATLLAALAAGPVRGGAGAPPPDRSFDAFGPGYKEPRVLPESFFNPFRVRAEAGAAKRDGPGATAEAVTDAISLRGVSGIVYAPGTGADRVIIGDQVFGLGDELAFPSPDKPGLAPLVAGTTVVLREVDPGHLALDISAEGETPRRVSFPLKAFLAP